MYLIFTFREFKSIHKGETAILHLRFGTEKNRRLGSKKARYNRAFRRRHLFCLHIMAQKERLDGFSTRRVRFANSLFYVPFCSAKRRTKSSSLSKQIHIYKKKKHKGKILVLFLAQKERLELSRRLPDLRP